MSTHTVDDEVDSLEPDNNQKILSTKLSRALKTTGMAAKSGIRHLNYLKNKTLTSSTDIEKKAQLKLDHEAEIGRILFSGLSQMRGTALKASQLLSLEADLLPEGIRKELAKSCYQVPPINRALIRKMFIQELGKEPSKVFDKFEPQAWAAASLGQVHKASITLPETGEQQTVAVKIQYPGIGESIDSDLKMLSFVLNGLSKTTSHVPNKHVLETTLDEIERCLKDEINYEQEAENTRWFAHNLNVAGVRIPKVYNAFSTQRVICTEFLEGLHVEEWLSTNPTQAQRNRAGQIIFNIFTHGAFELNALHADPHMGNYLFLANGDIGLIDFGCVKKLDKAFTENMGHLVSAILNKNQPQVFESYKQLRILSQDMEYDRYINHVYPILGPLQDWMSTPYAPTGKDINGNTLSGPTESNYYDFSQLPPPPTDMNRANHKTAMESLYSLTRDQLYFDRSYFGVYQLLRKMKAVVDTSNKWIKASK